jgi:hypothetical protein
MGISLIGYVAQTPARHRTTPGERGTVFIR